MWSLRGRGETPTLTALAPTTRAARPTTRAARTPLIKRWARRRRASLGAIAKFERDLMRERNPHRLGTARRRHGPVAARAADDTSSARVPLTSNTWVMLLLISFLLLATRAADPPG